MDVVAGERLAVGVDHGSVVAQTRLALSLHVPFLLAVTAADVAVVVAVALVAVAVAVAGLLEVGSLERQLAVAAADEVDLLELFVGEEVSGDGRQHVLGVLVVGKAERSFFQRCDASSQRGEGIFHADSL